MALGDEGSGRQLCGRAQPKVLLEEANLRRSGLVENLARPVQQSEVTTLDFEPLVPPGGAVPTRAGRRLAPPQASHPPARRWGNHGQVSRRARRTDGARSPVTAAIARVFTSRRDDTHVDESRARAAALRSASTSASTSWDFTTSIWFPLRVEISSATGWVGGAELPLDDANMQPKVLQVLCGRRVETFIAGVKRLAKFSVRPVPRSQHLERGVGSLRPGEPDALAADHSGRREPEWTETGLNRCETTKMRLLCE